ncbi:hypothetical protein ACFQRK_17325 [Parapedobacter sp. GCM10030251]|uniref:hypothetical protein n=1 Tax=Parapedobacter sp. GCM10030251 TaxID=3273419 RepID=UPI00361BF082
MAITKGKPYQRNRTAIQLYVINLEKRVDRLGHISRELVKKREFKFKVVKAVEYPIGAIGLWKTINQIINSACNSEKDLVIICEDDHTFTSDYSEALLLNVIENAKEIDADILLGGVSWFTNCVPITEHLYWVEKFSGLQFAVIFRKFYDTILNTTFYAGDAADYRISALSDKIYFIFPFISIQKEFGYSDVTTKNNETNRVETLFKDSAERVKAVDQVIQSYKERMTLVRHGDVGIGETEGISISTYILSPIIGEKKNSDITCQFDDKEEFDIQFIESHTHSNYEIAYWLSLQNIVRQAIFNEDDVIVICESDHQFTEFYVRERFVRQIIDLNNLGLELLCGGVDDFDMAVPITKDKFWIGAFKSASFLVLYRSVFGKILETSFNEQSTRESLFRELTSNKMLLFPFISRRKEFYNPSLSNEKLTSSELVISRLEKIRDVASSSGLI